MNDYTTLAGIDARRLVADRGLRWEAQQRPSAVARRLQALPAGILQGVLDALVPYLPAPPAGDTLPERLSHAIGAFGPLPLDRPAWAAREQAVDLTTLVQLAGAIRRGFVLRPQWWGDRVAYDGDPFDGGAVKDAWHAATPLALGGGAFRGEVSVLWGDVVVAVYDIDRYDLEGGEWTLAPGRPLTGRLVCKAYGVGSPGYHWRLQVTDPDGAMALDLAGPYADFSGAERRFWLEREPDRCQGGLQEWDLLPGEALAALAAYSQEEVVA